jgi:hypothetical protein
MSTPPRKFFEDFVRRSFEEFRANPHDEYLAKTAVANANDMAERMLHHYAKTYRVYGLDVGEASKYRQMLADKECDEFGLVRDVAENHKHFRLTRRANTRRVSSAAQTGSKSVKWKNNAGDEITFVNNAGEQVNFDTNVLVDLDDGSTRPLLPILEAVVAMWEKLSTP